MPPVQARRKFAERTLQRAQQQGGLTLLVDGPPGVGKTYVLRELVNATLTDGRWRVTVMRADEVERGEPYSFIERFVASGLIPNWHFAPDPQTTPIPVARECIQQLTSGSEATGRVIILDDAQWIDDESQRVLRYLIPRLHRRNMMLAFGVRAPHEPGSFGEFLTGLVDDSPLDTVLHVQPLSVREVRLLVAERLGVGVSDHTAQRIQVASGGTFLEVDSILTSLTSHEVARLHLAWDPPVAVTNLESTPLLHQFMGLSPQVRATCEIVCLAGHELSRPELSTVAKQLGEPVHLDEAVSAGVLTIQSFNSTAVPRHKLLAQAVVETIDAERSTAVLHALAAVTTGHYSLRHTLLGADGWDEDLHRRVNEYTEEAAAQGRFGTVVEILRAALGVATEKDARTELLQSLSLVHLRAKNSYLMLDLLDELGQLDPSLFHEFLYTVVAAHRGVGEIPQEAVQRLLFSTAETSDERVILAFLAFLVVIISMRTSSPAEVQMLIKHAITLAGRAPRDAQELTDPRLTWMVAQDEYLLVLDCYRMVQDQVTGDKDSVIQALPGLTQRIQDLPDSPFKVDAIVAVAGGHFSVGAAEVGYTLAKQGVELLDRVNEPWAGSTIQLIFAHALVLSGEYRAATEIIELTQEVSYNSLDVEARSSWAALRVSIAAITGEEYPDTYIEQARHQHELSWEGYSPDLALMAECDLARVRGDHAGVIEVTTGAWATRLNDTRHGFLTYRAHAHIDMGQLDEATSLIEQLTYWRGGKWQEYWGTLDWLHARLAEARGDHDRAQWHYEAATTQSLFPLPSGQTLTDYGQFLLRQGNREEGQKVLTSAATTLETIGAEAFLPRVRQLLTDAQRTEGEQSVKFLGTLTDRERQIAFQLAKGRSNNQIAESLVVSVATVRSHVSSVLRKLHLSSRGEVARQLRNTSDISN